MAALKKNFTTLSIVFCHNHILRDIEHWVKGHGGKREDVKVLKDHVEQLIDSTTPGEFEARYHAFAQGWPEDFLCYFDQHLKSDIFENTAAFYTKQFVAFKDKTTTNNMSESMNRMIKNQNEWRGLQVDAMVLSLYYMQSYFLFEFQRAKCGLGNYADKQNLFSSERFTNALFSSFGRYYQEGQVHHRK